MESQSDIGNGPVTNMERVPVIEDQEIQRSYEKRANGIGNGEMQRRVKNIPVLEKRRLLALERHIKRKRRRRPYVKKMKSADKTEHQLGKTMVATNEKLLDDPGAFDLKDEVIQVSGGKGTEDCSQSEIEGTRMAALDKHENGQTPNELSEDFEIPSSKMDAGKDKQQSVQFDSLVEYLLVRVKSEILEKVEGEFKSQNDVKQLNVEEEGQIKKDEGTCMEVKRVENITHVKKVNSSPPKDSRHINNEDLKKEKENFKDEGHKRLERAKDNENKIVHTGDENAEQSSNTSSNGSKEPKPEEPEMEAIKTDQLIKPERENGKTGFDIRKKLVVDDDEEENDDEDDDDDDDGFMPRKLFFFSFSEFKKEETSA